MFEEITIKFISYIHFTYEQLFSPLTLLQDHPVFHMLISHKSPNSALISTPLIFSNFLINSRVQCQSHPDTQDTLMKQIRGIFYFFSEEVPKEANNVTTQSQLLCDSSSFRITV